MTPEQEKAAEHLTEVAQRLRAQIALLKAGVNNILLLAQKSAPVTMPEGISLVEHCRKTLTNHKAPAAPPDPVTAKTPQYLRQVAEDLSTEQDRLRSGLTLIQRIAEQRANIQTAERTSLAEYVNKLLTPAPFVPPTKSAS